MPLRDADRIRARVLRALREERFRGSFSSGSSWFVNYAPPDIISFEHATHQGGMYLVQIEGDEICEPYFCSPLELWFLQSLLDPRLALDLLHMPVVQDFMGKQFLFGIFHPREYLYTCLRSQELAETFPIRISSLELKVRLSLERIHGKLLPSTMSFVAQPELYASFWSTRSEGLSFFYF